MNNNQTAERFSECCAPYAGMVYRHCLHMLRTPHDAEDAAQEAMLRAFRAYGDFHGTAVATWLFRIAHNTCLDVLKSARRKREQVTLDEWQDAGGELLDEAATPEESYVRRAEDSALWAAVSELPAQQQVLLSLYYGEGVSYEELSRLTGLPNGTVKSRLSRAKAALSKRLEKEKKETGNL